jgi:predicted 2-oxoglutarate/Fe(II)-dependent dioxygenase YbiX
MSEVKLAESALVQFVVGGNPYTLSLADIKKYPESFFARAVDEKWRTNESPIEVQRDGDIFRFVSAFLVSDRLPRGRGGSKLSADTVAAIKMEADFYNLPQLSRECDAPKTDEDRIQTFTTLRSYVERAKNWVSFYYQVDNNCAYPSKHSHLSPLVDALAAVWAPFCVRGTIDKDFGSLNLFKSSTLKKIQICELLTECQESAFGKGTETVLDPTVRRSHELTANRLNSETLEDIAANLEYEVKRLVPHGKVELRPYKLVIYQEGGHFDAHRDTVRGDGHIGTLVLILNSKYTGGELEITHNGQTEVVTGPYSWVAMYGDCLHKINPVTSGVRVSLIFDIYNPALGRGITSAVPRAGDADGEADEQSMDEEEGSDYDDDEGEEESDDEDAGRFWEGPAHDLPKADDRVREVTDALRQIVIKGIDKELDASESVVICLAHKYPLCQAVPEFLKGGDLALYELLKDAFDAQVVACTVVHGWDEEENQHSVVAKLFTLFNPPTIAAGEATAPANNDSEEEDEVSQLYCVRICTSWC